jgi:hypothetical protein
MDTKEMCSLTVIGEDRICNSKCNKVWEPPMETSHMLGTSMTRQRLRKSVSKQQPVTKMTRTD